MEGGEEAMIRYPAVAGKFYKGSQDALLDEVSKFIAKGVKKETAMGIVSPHAGFMYSGKVAGAVYSRVNIADTLIILGPNHSGIGESNSIMTKGEWIMPNGNIQIDSELAGMILANSANLKEDESSHLQEHSIEVQLPFIQYFSSDFKIVPITMSLINYSICEDIGDAISKAISSSNISSTVIASTDMTHYESHISASKKDREAIQYITDLDPEGLFRYVTEKKMTMCGAAPTISTLVACRNLKASTAELISYMTSGEVSGDYEYVVGYAGVIITGDKKCL